MTSLDKVGRVLADAAAMAPSGDNTQPWRFTFDKQCSLFTVSLDPTKDPSPMNSAQNMARIACGAALENAWQTAEHNHWCPTLCPSNHEDSRSLSLTIPHDSCDPHIPDVMVQRCTNRQPYARTPLRPQQLTRLGEIFRQHDGIAVTDHAQLQELSRIIGAADRLMFSQTEFLRAFLKTVRFDQRPTESVEFGLSTGSLEISLFERQMLQSLQSLPDFILRQPLLTIPFEQKGKKTFRPRRWDCCFGNMR